MGYYYRVYLGLFKDLNFTKRRACW